MLKDTQHDELVTSLWIQLHIGVGLQGLALPLRIAFPCIQSPGAASVLDPLKAHSPGSICGSSVTAACRRAPPKLATGVKHPSELPACRLLLSRLEAVLSDKRQLAQSCPKSCNAWIHATVDGAGCGLDQTANASAASKVASQTLDNVTAPPAPAPVTHIDSDGQTLALWIARREGLRFQEAQRRSRPKPKVPMQPGKWASPLLPGPSPSDMSGVLSPAQAFPEIAPLPRKAKWD